MEEIGKELALEVLGTLKTAKDFVVEQAPSVIQELVVFKQVQYATLLLCAIGLIFFLRWLVLKGIAKCKEGDDDVGIPMAICGGVAFIAPAAMVTNFYYSGLVWLVAPKVALLEYLAEIVK